MFTKGFKKIAGKKKKKLKFCPKMTQGEICHFIKKKADHIMETGYAAGKPMEFEWKYVPKFPIDFAHSIKKDWPAWFKAEQDEWVYNHGPVERANHFDKWSN